MPTAKGWCQGVAARAKLYGRPVIAARAGGLAEQLDANSFLFSSDAELAEILNQIMAAKADKQPTSVA